MPGNLTHHAAGDLLAPAAPDGDIDAAATEMPPIHDGPPPTHRRGRLRANPWLAGGAVVVVLVGVGVGIYFGTRGSGTASASSTTTVETVSTGTIRQSVSATGTLAPAHEESLSFSASGQVTSVKVAVGATVKKGQTLATLESASLKSSVAQAKATVASDQARVDADGSASSTQLAADKAALQAAKDQLTAAETQLDDATMTSPISGAVAEVNIATGDSVSGGTQASGDTQTSGDTTDDAQIMVISTSSWIVNASVDATSVGLIKAGEQAQLTISGSDATVYGTISSVGLVSSSTSGTASYPVVIAVTGAPTGLHDGASVTASLIYKQLSNVVVVPALALRRDGTSEYVDKQVNGKTVRTAVKLGAQSGAQVQITSGLAAGDKVLVTQVQRPTTSSTTRTGTSNTGTGGGGFPGGGAGGGFPGGGGGGGFGG